MNYTFLHFFACELGYKDILIPNFVTIYPDCSGVNPDLPEVAISAGNVAIGINLVGLAVLLFVVAAVVAGIVVLVMRKKKEIK